MAASILSETPIFSEKLPQSSQKEPFFANGNNKPMSALSILCANEIYLSSFILCLAGSVLRLGIQLMRGSRDWHHVGLSQRCPFKR